MTRSVRRTTLALTIVLLATAALHLSSIDHNHRWWGDFALYMLHAQNIATGHPYADTPFIYNPQGNPGFSPPAYPPVYPLMLAPLVALFGIDLYVPKLLNLVLFLCCLLVYFRYLTDRLTHPDSRVIATALLAFSPWFQLMSNMILSDVPFLLFTFLALVSMDRLSGHQGRATPGYLALAVALGILIYLAYGARTLGLVLLPTALVFDAISSRKLRAGPLLAICVFVLLHQLQTRLLEVSPDHSYTRIIVDLSPQHTDSTPLSLPSMLQLQLAGIVQNIDSNVRLYARVMVNHWDNGLSMVLRVTLTGVTSLLALAGFAWLCRQRLRAMDVFFVLYIAALLVVPVSQDYRYLLPILPMLLFYTCRGAELLEQQLGGTQGSNMIPVVLLVAALLSYTGNMLLAQNKTPYLGVRDSDSTALFEYIRRHTATDSFIETGRPRIVALFTGRRASIYDLLQPPDLIMQGFRRNGATHLLLYKGMEEWAFPNRNAALIATEGRYLHVVYENTSFRLYRIDYQDMPSGQAP